MSLRRKLVLLASLVACTREPLVDPAAAMRPAATAIADDLAYGGLADGLREQIGVLRRSGKTLRFGAKTVEGTLYAQRLEGLVAAIDGGAADAYLRANFETYEVYGAEHWGEVKLTSYFEPVIHGSRKATEQFPEAVLKRPEDLLVIGTSDYWEPIKAISSMRGRLDAKKKNRVIPYYSREQIYDGALKGRNLELAWVDPIDGFFMQIQGSGSIDLDDGTTLRVGYADQNGHPYKAIGSLVVDVIPREKMGMDTIVAHLRTLTADARTSLLAANPSYVFFDVRQGPALTSNTTAAVAGRTIATDAKFFPKGALAVLTFDAPGPKKLTRLVVDQDTGGAIKGGGRVDLFWGRGPEAGRIAGTINQTATLHYLVPK